MTLALAVILAGGRGERLCPLTHAVATKDEVKVASKVIESSPDAASIRCVSGAAARMRLNWAPAIGIEEGIASSAPALVAVA